MWQPCGLMSVPLKVFDVKNVECATFVLPANALAHFIGNRRSEGLAQRAKFPGD
jgi:hypothetical protein